MREEINLLILIFRGRRRFPFGVLGEIGVVCEADFEEVEGGVGGEEAGCCQGDLHRMGVSVQGLIKLVRWMRGGKS